jgi:hypothetical protein
VQITTRGVSNEAIAAAAGLRSADDPQNASTADISNNGNSNSSSNSNIHSLNGLIDVLPGDASIVNVPPPPAKRGRKRKVPLEPSMALPPPPRPLPLEETDADGTITTTLDGGSILPPVAMLGAPLPKKRGRKPKNPPPSIAVGVELPQNLIHVQQQLPFGMRFNSQYVTVLPPLPPPPPPPDLSQLSRAHGMNNGHSHLPPVIFGGAVPPPPPQFALMQSLNGFTSVPPLPLPTDRGGFGNGNSSFLHHPLPPRRVP